MSTPAVEVDLPYLMQDEDRHGNARLFVRRYKRKIRIREKPGTTEFTTAYTAALERLEAHRPTRTPAEAAPAAPARRGTMGYLAAKYFESAEFRGLASAETRKQVIDECLAETVRDGSSDTFRDCPLKFVTAKKIRRLRDAKFNAGLMGAANNRRKYLSAMFTWGVDNDEAKSNPVRDTKKIKYATSGFLKWELEHVHKYRAHFPIGTKARLALELLLFVGVRRQDFVELGPQHVRAGLDGQKTIKFVPKKTQYVRMDPIEIPLMPTLAHVLENTQLGSLCFFPTEYGEPFTAAGFGNWFADRCKDAGVPGRAHGLRKCGATLAAEEGATIHQLMAMYGWTTPAQALVYTRLANQKRMAKEAAMALARGEAAAVLENERELQSAPPLISGGAPPQ